MKAARVGAGHARDKRSNRTHGVLLQFVNDPVIKSA